MDSTRKKLLPFFFPAFLILLMALVYSAAANERAATVSIPDEVLLRSIGEVLPIPLETESQYVQGDLTLQSLEKLEVRDRSIFLKGIVSGRNFTMNTTIAGKEISMNLGSAQLPVSCELFLRFDGNKKVLFITPRFTKPTTLYSTDPADALLLLLSALAEKEYPVELAAIQPIFAEVGERSISVQLEPIDILTQKGMLLIKMSPKISKGS